MVVKERMGHEARLGRGIDAVKLSQQVQRADGEREPGLLRPAEGALRSVADSVLFLAAP